MCSVYFSGGIIFPAVNNGFDAFEPKFEACRVLLVLLEWKLG
jgi:hypothetical protein